MLLTTFVFLTYKIKIVNPPPHLLVSSYPLAECIPTLTLPLVNCISELMLNYRYVVYDTKHLYFTYKLEQLTPPS